MSDPTRGHVHSRVAHPAPAPVSVPRVVRRFGDLTDRRPRRSQPLITPPMGPRR